MTTYPERKKPTTKMKLLAALSITVIVLSGFLVLFLANVGHVVEVKRPIRVACVGDSITQGLGYPGELWRMLGINYVVGNFGAGGATVLLSSDSPYVSESAFERAKAFLPDVVVIMLGTNDAYPSYFGHIDGFVNDYEVLIRSLQTLASKPKVWLVIPPPIFNVQGSGPNGVNLVQGVIPRVHQVAAELNLPTIDVYGALSSHPEDFIADGIHPNSQGAKVIATVVYEALFAGTSR